MREGAWDYCTVSSIEHNIYRRHMHREKYIGEKSSLRGDRLYTSILIINNL